MNVHDMYESFLTLNLWIDGKVICICVDQIDKQGMTAICVRSLSVASSRWLIAKDQYDQSTRHVEKKHLSFHDSWSRETNVQVRDSINMFQNAYGNFEGMLLSVWRLVWRRGLQETTSNCICKQKTFEEIDVGG